MLIELLCCEGCSPSILSLPHSGKVWLRRSFRRRRSSRWPGSERSRWGSCPEPWYTRCTSRGGRTAGTAPALGQSYTPCRLGAAPGSRSPSGAWPLGGATCRQHWRRARHQSPWHCRWESPGQPRLAA